MKQTKTIAKVWIYNLKWNVRAIHVLSPLGNKANKQWTLNKSQRDPRVVQTETLPPFLLV